MDTSFLIVMISIIAFTSGFAYGEERNTDLDKELFKDLSKQKFAFAFAKRGRDEEMNEEQVQRVIRELSSKKFAFAFAKRFTGTDDEEEFSRFPRLSFA
ncbi:hypothetical protein DICVIV_05465 [Dictyocaulus viviparus]|uniref:Uncharacterized protein n=1 Tax=Dictyocaulus viviparus TaxID=29172 RepID=A0A0D8XV77_DICVI|nr:hypothetical protein DICVIV_05465 [Dictyocaulus viviparus]